MKSTSTPAPVFVRFTQPATWVVALAISCLATPAFASPDLSAYARARAADGDGRASIAIAAYAEALDAAPDNVVIARRAYREAIEAGDYALVGKSLTALDAAGAAPPDAVLFTLIEAIRTGNAAAQSAALARIDKSSFDFLAAPMRAWAAVGGQDDPVAILDAGKRNALTARINGENRALLLIATDRIDDGIAALRALLGTTSAGLDLRINAAQLLAGKGRTDLAQALLRGDDPVLAAFRARGDLGATASPAFGIARLYARIAADLVQGEEDAMPFTIALSRAALRLEPGNDRVRLLLADALSRGRSTDSAMTTLDQIKPASPFYSGALVARVTMLDRAGDTAAALEAARKLSAAPDADSDAAELNGRLLSNAGRHADAARAFQLAVKRSGKGARWTLFLQLGSALDNAGRWPDARKAFETAAAMAPDAPLALNALAYARIEHHEDVVAARAMLERASRLDPDNASIVDSLGWAYFRTGDTAKALPMLERAARAEPANAEISEHLGDAYWSLGRRYEARYAWSAASVVAEAGDMARLNAKIARGMPRP